ncbi:MAG: PHP domain-containing protein, partial [Gammaproteobacteria bacterium]
MSRPFVHLRLHSEYSLVDGLVRIEDLVERAAALGMPAVAVTDFANLFALIKFYKEAAAAGIKPIAGADVLVEEAGGVFPLTLLIAGQPGYRNLMQLLSRGWLEGQQLGRPVLSRAWFTGHSDGLIALSGGRDGAIGQALLAGKAEQAAQLLQDWRALFPGAFYLELSRAGRPGEEDYLHLAVALAATHDCPVVATNDVRFLAADDFEAHEARVCIQEGRTLADPRRPRAYSPLQYLRPAGEMHALFEDIPEALENALEIARRCTLTLDLGRNHLPDFPVPGGGSPEDYLARVSREGLSARIASMARPFATEEVYLERLQFELNTINAMGFAGYFLIVMDFIRWAKSNGVPVGPGRGSGAG